MNNYELERIEKVLLGIDQELTPYFDLVVGSNRGVETVLLYRVLRSQAEILEAQLESRLYSKIRNIWIEIVETDPANENFVYKP